MLVTRKKLSIKNGRGHATKMVSEQMESGTIGTKGNLGNPSTSLTNLSLDKTFLFKSGTSQKVVACEEGVSYTPAGQMEIRKGLLGTNKNHLGSGLDDRSNQVERP